MPTDIAKVSQPTPENLLKAIIDANFDISQVVLNSDACLVRFWSASMHMPDLGRLQRINDQRLYSNLKFHLLQMMPKDQASHVAKGLAALIDGLWLRGSLSDHQAFDRDLARSIAYDYVDMQLRLIEQIRQEQQNE